MKTYLYFVSYWAEKDTDGAGWVENIHQSFLRPITTGDITELEKELETELGYAYCAVISFQLLRVENDDSPSAEENVEVNSERE